ncbi:MAG: hypothetical protein JKY65_22005 [Planctomycetes bacterium]|nr:hypothetical protein [Planctomycetota bacterium]
MPDDLAYRSPPLTILQEGPDRIRMTIEATRAVWSIGMVLIPGSVLGAIWANRSMDDPGRWVVMGSLVLLAVALVGFLAYRKVTIVDRGTGYITQVTSFMGVPWRTSTGLGTKPTTRIKVRSTTTTRGGTKSTTSDFLALLEGRQLVVVGPVRRDRAAAEADAAAVQAFLDKPLEGDDSS